MFKMRIEAYGASYHVELKKRDFETQRLSNEENTKDVQQFMKALVSAHETIKIFIGGSCDIGFFCSNM